MKDFISEIKKIYTDELIYAFSEKSIEMFISHKCTNEVEVPVIHNWKRKLLVVLLAAWDIPDIAFLSITNSTDYRNADKVASVEQLVDLYRDYSNKHSVADDIRNANCNSIFRMVLGMTAEQFLYQRFWWIFEKFNRDYYILMAATSFEHRNEIDTNAVVKDVFGYSADDYIAVLLCVFWLCTKHPDPLSAPEKLYHKKENTVLTRKNIEEFIKYYSCTYKELRENPLGKQLLYSKPFVCTQRHKSYLSVSIFLVAMMLANSLYWLVRDYYLEKGKKENRNDQTFVNAFGVLFEDYIKDLASKYCVPSEWRQLPAPSKKKGADFMFDFGSLQVIIESKSALLKLDAKQQIPNIQSINSFFDNTIKKSYKQLVSSYDDLRATTTIPIVKVILLYDEFSNTAIIERSMAEIFDTDFSCFVMTIRELEMLLYLHCNDKVKEQLVVDQILEGIKMKDSRKNIGSIFTELGIYENPHLDGEMNYFSKLMEHFKNNLT